MKQREGKRKMGARSKRTLKRKMWASRCNALALAAWTEAVLAGLQTPCIFGFRAIKLLSCSGPRALELARNAW